MELRRTVDDSLPTVGRGLLFRVDAVAQGQAVRSAGGRAYPVSTVILTVTAQVPKHRCRRCRRVRAAAAQELDQRRDAARGHNQRRIGNP